MRKVHSNILLEYYVCDIHATCPLKMHWTEVRSTIMVFLPLLQCDNLFEYVWVCMSIQMCMQIDVNEELWICVCTVLWVHNMYNVLLVVVEYACTSYYATIGHLAYQDKESRRNYHYLIESKQKMWQVSKKLKRDSKTRRVLMKMETKPFTMTTSG